MWKEWKKNARLDEETSARLWRGIEARLFCGARRNPRLRLASAAAALFFAAMLVAVWRSPSSRGGGVESLEVYSADILTDPLGEDAAPEAWPPLPFAEEATFRLDVEEDDVEPWLEDVWRI